MTDKKTPPDSLEKVEKSAQRIIEGRKAAQKKTENNTSASPQQQKTAETSPKINWSFRGLILLMVFLLGAGGGIYLLPHITERLPIVAQWVGTDQSGLEAGSQLDPKIAALESRLAQQQKQIDALTIVQETYGQKIISLSERPHIQSLPHQTEADPPPPASNPAVIERLERLERLEQARQAAEENPEDRAQAARIDMLIGRMSQLESSFVPLSKGLADAQSARIERGQLAETVSVQRDKLDHLEGRLENVESFAARDTSGALLAFRLGELRRKVASGRPFSTEINTVQSLTEQGSFAYNSSLADSLLWLDQQSKGIAPPERLRDQFQSLIPALMQAAGQGADDPWWKRAYLSTKNLIMVRQTTLSGDAGKNLDHSLAEMENLLERRDVAGAVIRAKQLPESLQPALNDWLSKAEQSLRAAEELDRIDSLTATYYLATPEGKYPAERDNNSPAPSGEEANL